MKKIISILLVLVSLFCLSSCRAGDIENGIYAPYWAFWDYSSGSSFTYSASEIKEIEIFWVDGRIEVIASDAEEFAVVENSESLTNDAKMHYLIKGDRLIIHYSKALYKEDIDESKKHIRVEIPEGIEIDIDSVTASINIGEMALGEINLTNISGNIELSNLACSKVKIENVDGHITSGGIVADEFSAGSVSGTLDISNISANKIDVSTVSGKTVLGIAKKSNVEISGISGNVQLYIAEEIGATIEFSTVSGTFSSEKPHKTNKKTYTFGLGEAVIEVETVSGNLEIK